MLRKIGRGILTAAGVYGGYIIGTNLTLAEAAATQVGLTASALASVHWSNYKASK